VRNASCEEIAEIPKESAEILEDAFPNQFPDSLKLRLEKHLASQGEYPNENGLPKVRA